MINEIDAAQGKHLDATAAAVKRFLLTQIAEIAEAIIADLDDLNVEMILDKKPSLTDGKLWYEISDGVPVLKLQVGGLAYTFNPDSSATLPVIKIQPTFYAAVIPYGVAKVKPTLYAAVIPFAAE